jgi:hypothetical protein
MNPIFLNSPSSYICPNFKVGEDLKIYCLSNSNNFSNEVIEKKKSPKYYYLLKISFRLNLVKDFPDY